MLDEREYKKKRVEIFAEEKHFGQKDKEGKNYMGHLRYVADMSENIAREIGKSDSFCDNCYIIGMLHDILEDTKTTPAELKNYGLSDEVVFAIKQLTRKEDESYGDFVKRAATNPYGLIVKYADLMHNLDITRLEKIKKDDVDRLNKYLKWFRYLQEKFWR